MIVAKMPRSRLLSRDAKVVAVTAVDANEIPDFGERFVQFARTRLKTTDIDSLKAQIRHQVTIDLPVIER